jgi:hypothetical protein
LFCSWFRLSCSPVIRQRVTIVGSGFFLGFSTPIIFTTQDGTPAALVVTVNGAPASSSITLVNMPTGMTAQITLCDTTDLAERHRSDQRTATNDSLSVAKLSVTLDGYGTAFLHMVP